ncbi:AEC family transporter [Ruegeria sp. WL0004]|uniref:AEC family transporter n=1 Tax=Ruegeria marisflavi TaxID=2984152 RepID=A0ABT2WK25_9RHOB|nr:AEC family transporter [Ruegeria sp. WL0004]MCU9836229.1 AEC family transporter [Ruegeria sp. WL0004]
MNLTVTVIEIVAPVFLLAAVGFGWVRMGFEYRTQFVTRLATTLAVPCLIFTALIKTEIPGGDLVRFAVAVIGVVLVLSLVVELGLRALGLDRRTYLPPLVFGNTGNLGLPLCIFAFGETGLGYAIVFFSVSALWSFSYGIHVVAGRGSLAKVVREPMVWSTLLGALFLWQGWQTPRFLTNAMELIGQMAVPLMLITLGVAIARLSTHKVSRAVILSLVKLALCLALGWAVALGMGLEGVAFGVLVVQMCTPVAVTSYMLAERFEADADAVAGMVMVSTLISVAALPLVLALVL